MVNSWKKVALGRVAKVVGGFAFKSRDFVTRGVPVVKIKNVRHRDVDLSSVDHVTEEHADSCSRFLIKHGDVLISMTGSGIQAPASIVGRVARHSGEDRAFLINQRVGRFEILEPTELDIRYLYYFLSQRAVQLELVSIATGSANQVNLSAVQIEALDIPLPPLSVQRRIAQVLGNLDDKIEVNSEIIQTLQRTSHMLFKSWFEDFEPVIDNALVNGNPIPEEFASRADVRRAALADGTANRSIADIFPDAFELTESMGWIPKGWEVKSLDQIAIYRNGLALQKFGPIDGEPSLPIVKIAQLKSGRATWDEPCSSRITSECVLNDGDVVFSWSGSLMVTIWCGGTAALNQHLFRVTSTTFPKWLYWEWTRYHLSEFQRIAADKAVTMGHIKRSHLSDARCAIPGELVVASGSDIFGPLLEQMILLETQSRVLSECRSLLLPKLISGEIEASYAEQPTVEALS